ncbi:MAG TPA: DUF1616 domain-containing protein [Ktedonobacteraceae bacterium]|nr:DUF1616 domain-containing protein [Ktedonobacteraceae bacterium]
MKQKAVDIPILVVIILTIVAVALVFTVPSDWPSLRILTLPLAFVLPGYAMMRALFRGKQFGNAEYITFSLGLSLAIVILSGLVLNSTPYGLQERSWAVILGSITLGASAVAILRQMRQGEASRWRSGFKDIHLTFRQGLLLGIAALIFGGAFAVTIIGAQQQPQSGFTQLWMLPASSTTKGKGAVRLGLSNKESKPMQYSLAVDFNGKVVKVWPAIDLSPNQQWEVTLVLPQSLPANSATPPAKIDATLYRANDSKTVYRHVVLWLGP